MEDLEVIARYSWIAVQERFDRFSSGVSVEQLKNTLGKTIERSDNMSFFVVEVNGKYVGHVNISRYSERNSHVGEINIGLLPYFRGKGLDLSSLRRC